ncbi:hypothetical protein OCB08_17780 [Bacillus cereus]|uniref:Uncharacterized protein n=2 Tax=Bacillus cereus group TaxID=86661 RepID=A0A1C4DIT0_BACCE|nr:MULTISPECIES: hypothetical protein [Bacillus cereus group]EOP98698.1 hypothetical protein IIY_05239 [Bacillus cereus VD140]MBL3889398.1 hypothetical protein [Bacillus cereus]MCC2368513.1 hypothetical protein [Bacillus cereus]MCC2396594.1 hypothetical protein [Bacillus cereus]MCC2451523.1 hypothetical protein [Bacillus cereus]
MTDRCEIYCFDEVKVNQVLVQKLQDHCNESINIGYNDTITLQKVCDQYGKGKCIQMEALPA